MSGQLLWAANPFSELGASRLTLTQRNTNDPEWDEASLSLALDQSFKLKFIKGHQCGGGHASALNPTEFLPDEHRCLYTVSNLQLAQNARHVMLHGFFR